MSKVSEVLTMLERSRALGLSAEVQATLDAAILAEMGIQRKSAPAAVQLDIFAARFEPSTTSSSTSSTTSSSTDAPTPEERRAALEHKKREAVRLRMMYAEWMWSDPTLRQIGEWIGQAVKVAGSQRALALLLGVTGSIIESYLGGFTMPGAREARIIAGLIRLPEELVVSMCDAALDHLDELRAAQGLRRAVRRSFSNPPFSGEE
jgi:DNA-binding transcriptional regulator YdaS (Cro superfamily)